MEVNLEEKESSRPAQKWNFPGSPRRRRRFGDDNMITNYQRIFPKGYAALLSKSPPPVPPAFLRRIGVTEINGVGKVKVMLRVASGENGSYFSVDKRKKQVTLLDPTAGVTLTADDRKPTVAAPKMFAFDAIFTEDDSQTEVCSSALTDVIHAVINGNDGCLFCFGHAGLGKSHTMLGTPEANHTLGAIPCAIAWLFRGIAEQRHKTGARFSVRVSCVELTTGQQQLRDLLANYANDSEQSPAVFLRDDPLIGSLQLQQHSELRAPTPERAGFYLDAAIADRKSEHNDAHMLYTLHVYQYSVAGKGGVAGGRSRLHLLNLGNPDRGKAAGGIPLSGLGNILLAIFNGQKHLPYKENKLTQLLKECLGPLTCYATMIAHVSSNVQHYNETLTTVQLASRIHRMRRRRIKFTNNHSQVNGSSGSSGDEAVRHINECDPSSSDLSADTVIYVGPSTDDATDGEHPPVYIPCLNSGDNRCTINRVLRGTEAEKPIQIIEEKPQISKNNKSSKTFIQTATKQTSPAHSNTVKSSPLKRISAKIPIDKSFDSPNIIKIPIISSLHPNILEEQWIDGPRISKVKVAEARHLLKDLPYKKETWIDGPMHYSSPLLCPSQKHSSGRYGFMDNHKKIMIRKWVENQSSQIQRLKHSQVRIPYESSHSSGVVKDITRIKLYQDDNDMTSVSIVDRYIDRMENKKPSNRTNENFNSDGIRNIDRHSPFSSDEKCRNFDFRDFEDDDEEIIVPPALPLIKILNRQLSTESLDSSYRTGRQHSNQIVLSSNRTFDIIEVEHIAPVATRDSCLQVTEEDIAMSMGKHQISVSDEKEHPLRILSEENLTIVSTFTGAHASIPKDLKFNHRDFEYIININSNTIINKLGEKYTENQNNVNNIKLITWDQISDYENTGINSMSVMSDSERHKPSISLRSGILKRSYIDHNDFLEQESNYKFDQLAQLHELYQTKLAMANVPDSEAHQHEKSTTGDQEISACTSLVVRQPSRCHSLSFSDVLFSDNISNHGSIYSEPAYIPHKKDQQNFCNSCRQMISRPSTAFHWFPTDSSDVASRQKYESKDVSNLRHPDGASNPNLDEEEQRIPGNGASGSDAEEDYIEYKTQFLPSRAIVENDRLQGGNKVPVSNPLQLTIPSWLPSSSQVQRKSSFGYNRESYDSGADSIPRVTKLSPVTILRHRTESSGYDSVVRDSEISSIASDASRQTNALHESQGGAFGVLTSTLCGCFSNGTGRGRLRAPGSTSGSFHAREQRRNLRTNTIGASWHDIQDRQPASSHTTS